MTENEEDIITWCEHRADKKCKHVLKLEADLNFALNMSKKRGDEILQLEKEKAELIEAVKQYFLAFDNGNGLCLNCFYMTDLGCENMECGKYDIEKLLKKHGVEI